MNLLAILPSIPFTNPVLIFFIVLTIILLAPLLLNKLRIPHIIGLIIAGMLVGPNGLGLVLRDNSFEIFGKVGLLYLMFLAGLEMDINDFKKNKAKGITFGIYTFLVPMLLGTVISYYMLHFSLVTSVLLASMYASHTLVAYPIVSRYGISRTTSVTITIAGTIITVFLALLILAVITGMYHGQINELFWIRLFISISVYCAFVIFAYPRITRWFLKKYDDNVAQYIFILALVFCASFLAELAGLEGIIGAFLAGVVLNRFIPAVSPLMNRIEFVGNALFIPYFLIGVGMLIDLHVIFGSEGEALKVAAVMITVALGGKWIASWMTQKIYRMVALERELMFGLSNAQAAATLAAVLVGYSIILPNGERLLNEDVLNGTVLLILITCIVSSFTTERAARRIAMEESHPDEERLRAPEKILIPIANPATIEYLMNLSLVIRDPKQKDNLVALNVLNDHVDSERLELQGKRCLERAAKITASAGVDLKCITRYDLNIASGIIHSAREHDATDIIIGLHYKSNIVDSYFGTLAESLLKGIHREVMVARFLMPVNTLRRIIIAVPPKAEYEAGFQKWVEHFCRMGMNLGCRVHFFANGQTSQLLQALVKKKYSDTMTEFSLLDDWEDLLLLTGQVNDDHLLVIISARRGSISYNSAFEKLPNQLGRYFNNNSLIVLYPDELGDPQDIQSFYNPQGSSERNYEKVGEWIYRWFKKNNS